ncbi:hypothetical protein GLOTRDRAFT_126221 [Gloeophyllum trabeum ATCC 11539]|uniref:Uncharacterized protein n=1 Tax=Gloeophyllum trabeum (strain ATCC 11539 / FP-39264 / Madison 617) TaxID=670483 RepID=S7RSS8_GLOTA|nr:uncharacterized protein GLOTRDRAFT_126221 [Gloeophyllum trabeum ATCC 11539]EPQ57730.1 hypothetical protein GLOTRDRAFT_126221 [Gloeophyllum trabeum ATCC 11539]
MKEVIDQSITLQYKVELAIAGMEDGPPSHVTTAERLQHLRKYSDSWAGAQFGSVEKLHCGRGPMLRLSGNVLGRCFDSSTLVFNILPGHARGVNAREWRYDDIGFMIKDYAIDVGQDLLVILSRAPSQDRAAGNHEEQMIYFLSLSTGKAHPQAVHSSTPLPYGVDTRDRCQLRLSGAFVGAMIPNALGEHRTEPHLVVWSWKEGTVRMWLSGASRIEDFTFGDGFLLTTVLPWEGGKPRLEAYNIDKRSACTKPIPWTGEMPCYTFQYPLYEEHLLMMELETIPSVASLPESEDAALFRGAPTDVYFLVQMYHERGSFEEQHDFRVTHVIPAAELTSRIRQTLGQPDPIRVCPWEEWGSNTVMTGPVYNYFPSRRMQSVACQRFIDWFNPIDRIMDSYTVMDNTVTLFDFRVHRIQRGLQGGRMKAHVAMDPDETFWVNHSMFLPCAKRTFSLPPAIRRPRGCLELAVTADNIVVYNDSTGNGLCYVLSI